MALPPSVFLTSMVQRYSDTYETANEIIYKIKRLDKVRLIWRIKQLYPYLATSNENHQDYIPLLIVGGL